MVSFLRVFLAYTMTLSLLITSLPIEVAQAASLTTDQWEEIKDTMELMVPVRKKDETLSETYYRFAPRLTPSQKSEFAEINKRLGYTIHKTKAVAAKVTIDSLIIKDGTQELVIKVEKDKKGENFISVNGQALTQKQVQSPLLTYEFLKKISVDPKEKKVSSWLWHLVVPESQALFGLSNSMLIGGGLVLAAIGVVLYKQLTKKEKSCKDKPATCCSINGSMVDLTNGCCTDSNDGIETGFQVCPKEMLIESTDTSTDTGTSTGVQ